ncbi:MFS transporter [Actinocrispum wychmicini]|uniref:EmrB/QacA subfamily drug resistance transporter n=1 Tax=Actinocrispum wychmicini TaxID=1213861 RepID=A0A4R2J944_9PSEU|nr:MFS transporter [Actinocrispum wychmicini]TCO52379.1 EmrB/QacA subfamily drug resistance transporter [Actinocrispum wychmicini]
MTDTLADVTTPHRWRWLALAALLVAEAMNLLDTTIVQVASPAIRADLTATDGQTQWLTAGYTLPFAVLLITGGRLGDILGRRRVFVIGVVTFVLCSALCALAPNILVLIVTRALQGAGAALIIPQTIGLIRTMFDGPERAKAFGAIGPVMALAAVSGPVLGGVLTDADVLGTGWRSVFLINVPLGLAVLLVSSLIREDRSAANPRLDVTGTVLVAAGTGLLIYPLVQGNDAGWPLWTWICLLLGLGTLGVFVRHQIGRTRSPLVEPGLFRDAVFPASMLMSLLFFAVMNGLMFVLVVFFQIGLGASAFDAGLAMSPWSAGLAVGSLTAGMVLVPRFGAKVMRLGVVVLVLGLVATALLITTPGPGLAWRLLVPLFVAGLGLGTFTPPFFTNALSQVRPHETGSAAGLLNAVQQFGSTVGVAVLGAVFFHSGPQLPLWLAVGMLAVVMALTFTGQRRNSPAE